MDKLFGPMEQIGIVVDNFEDPINHWTKNLKVGPFFILEHLELNDVYYKDGGARVNPTFNSYSVHHFCTFTPNINDDLEILESQGYKNIQGGKTQDGGSFAYLDHENNYGAILEIAQLSEGGYAMFEMIKKASKDWDGENAIMDIGEISI